MDTEELMKILEEQVINDFCEPENECDCEYFYDHGELVCKKCYTVKVQYVLPYTTYDRKDSYSVGYFKKHLAQINISYAYEKEAVKNFIAFENAFNELKCLWNRKSLISYDLILYCVLSKMDICPKPLKEFKINYKHVPMCKQVVEKLGWTDIFPICNKEMDSVIDQFVNQLKTIDENINGDEIKRVVLQVVAPKENTSVERRRCEYVFKMGSKKGDKCNKIIKNETEFCYCHTKKIKKDKTENEN